MTSFLLPVVTGEPSSSDPLQLAVAAHLARYRGLSREHTASDLRVFLCWCAERSLDPLTAQRAQLELYVRWCQEVRQFKPSTVSRRTSVVCGFYRTCVTDGILEHSPAEWLRRPTVSPESPTLGLTHLQFEALLTTARESSNSFDFALVAMLGLLGLRIFEACAANVEDLGKARRPPRGQRDDAEGVADRNSAAGLGPAPDASAHSRDERSRLCVVRSVRWLGCRVSSRTQYGRPGSRGQSHQFP